MTALAHSTAIILAGGQSSRMGEDKGLMLLEGKPMIQHIIETVSEIANEVIIIANDSDYEQFALPVYADLVKEKGPLAGIVTGLSASKTELNWIISCDTPYVSPDLLKTLMSNLKTVEAVIPIHGDKKHPLIGAYRKATLPIFQKSLALNQLKIMTIISQLDLQIMDANQFDLLNFKNLNSKQDL